MKERETAYGCLCRIVIDRQYSNIVLRSVADASPLITQLVYGTLRNYRLVRQCWSVHARKKVPERIALILDMAVYELLMLSKPSYATISEAVEIAKKQKGGAYASMVNAILRKVSKEDMRTDDIAVRTSHPDWLYSLWKAHYGLEKAEGIMNEDLEQPQISLRINPERITREQLLQDERFSAGVVEGCFNYQGNIVDNPFFKENKIIIQSQSSQLVVNRMDLQSDMRVLDLCAAPGSKSMQMAFAVGPKGKVVANELHELRCKLIRSNLQKQGIENVEVCCHDGRQIADYYHPGSFDAVLLDAPCSGLGTLKHKPEIKMHIQPADLDDIVELQRELLESAAEMVADKGILMYSTCTLNKKENERQIEAFVKSHPDFSLISSKTVFPQDFHSDGFFLAKLRKN